ncbi:MAG: Uma2 family endonuclease [Anaerolineae bacterium]|nr:Uma2 family endonuclease [Thermoflexales bacterium]MDW8396231.1 Uma2 family endonuclease [Anaerolineae bacterium]
MSAQTLPAAQTEERTSSVQQLSPEVLAEYYRALEALVTEDDEPVDNLFSERQQRLLADALETSWSHPRFGKRFLAAVNVGVFYALDQPAVVPDLLLSIGIEPHRSAVKKEEKSYFIWVYGKPPELVVEIVSNTRGNELGQKADLYGWMRVRYYVVYDPQRLLGAEGLHVLENTLMGWQPMPGRWLQGLNLGVTLWQGVYGGMEATWLRWCDAAGRVLPTGQERAELERQRAERLAAKLRALGVNPDDLAD